MLNNISKDHLKGLNPSWNYGKIYASHISKKLICDRYKNLEKLVVRIISLFGGIFMLEINQMIILGSFRDGLRALDIL